ncbi:hypothetical protein MIND_00836000 [Mycena indigotica]|uniref:Uncharacterized protein n=1 Tax=Mycena indigotica TaxID=2126181 RepID=A0A8H6SFY9_9AGAR|nr:uncharacterized protein MIND_00836000 [Mycena indigotica]KAF7298880.1 hypothetical protein MIND_00836000 [Mycena indigotica]
MMLFTTLLSLFVTSTLCAPTLGPQELIVIDPEITSPKSGDIWKAGTTQLVTWKTDSIPPGSANTTGLLLLGHPSTIHQDGKDYPSENLDIKHPLASGFYLTDGNVTVVVPNWIRPRTNYMVVLFGDSGNTSPLFTITHGSQTHTT